MPWAFYNQRTHFNQFQPIKPQPRH
uniref:Uncharacterized protein n=1 Tax=Rhizophora mucronata TaxID=61149 RepID=A0A2P2Q905_RHIMU